MSGPVVEERIEGVRYLWFKTPDYKGNGARRALNMFAFVSQLFQRQEQLAGTCAKGAVIASSTYPLDILPAAAISKAANARLAFEVHDLWPLSPMELGGMSRFHPFVLMMQRAENFAYRHAQKVVSLLPKAAPHMCRHGLNPEKFVHVPNGIDPSEWLSSASEIPCAHREALAEVNRAGGFAVLYAGAHGLANALPSVVRAAELLRDTPAVFLLVGQGPEKPALQELALRLKLRNVVFLPPVPKSAIPPLLAGAGALLISLRRTPIFRFGISPNKLIDYMMAARPVIQAIKAGNDMVSDSGCGITVQPEDSRAIAAAVLRLMRLTPAERAEMGARGRSYVMALHDYRVLARDFIEALETA
jgi:glycosyltransferase involved in cell wall biosynthesis